MVEYEVLNEIMTSTVAQLFTINRLKPSQLNESKIDIPLGRSSTASLNGDKQQYTNASEWVSTQGKKFLEDSLARLQIDTKKYTFREQTITQLTVEELNKIKRNVKNELKKYD